MLNIRATVDKNQTHNFIGYMSVHIVYEIMPIKSFGLIPENLEYFSWHNG